MVQCPICCENMNKSTRNPVACEFGDCGFVACKECVRSYLTSTTAEPHCMQCKKAWSQAFLVDSLNRSWMNKDYKTHRTALLLDRELSRMPETMPRAETVLQERANDARRKEIYRQIAECRARERQLCREYRDVGLLKENDQETTKRAFIMGCPKSDCRGYLSTQYKCGLCEAYTCRHCLEAIGYSREEMDAHQCNPDAVATADAIRKDTKPCPKCGERIFKISGCDQMWCPSCQTAFSWRTGKIDTGIVHNPEFYRWRRTNGADEAQDHCCGMQARPHVALRVLNRAAKYEPCTKLVTRLRMAYQLLQHCSVVELEQARRRVRTASDTEDLRVRYILNEMTREELVTSSAAADRSLQRWREIVNIMELWVQEGLGIISDCVTRDLPANAEEYAVRLTERLKTLVNLANLCNTLFARVSRTHAVKVPQISSNGKEGSWSLERIRFTGKSGSLGVVDPVEPQNPTETPPQIE